MSVDPAGFEQTQRNDLPFLNNMDSLKSAFRGKGTARSESDISTRSSSTPRFINPPALTPSPAEHCAPQPHEPSASSTKSKFALKPLPEKGRLECTVYGLRPWDSPRDAPQSRPETPFKHPSENSKRKILPVVRERCPGEGSEISEPEKKN